MKADREGKWNINSPLDVFGIGGVFKKSRMLRFRGFAVLRVGR